MKKKLTIALLAALALGACSEQEMNDNQGKNGQQITFVPTIATDWNGAVTRAAMQQNAAAKVQQLTDGLYLHTVVSPGFESDRQQQKVTRGTKYTNETFADNETFYVSGYRYGSTETVASVAEANFVASAPVTKQSGFWKATQSFYIPYAGDKIDFFAWFVPSGTGVSVTNAQGGTQLTYNMPATISEQPDLLAAVSRKNTYNDEENYAVPLTFGHQLTCVNFEMDDNMVPGTITEIAFLNVYTSATLTIGGSWNTENGTKSNATTFAVNFPTVDGNQLVGSNARTILSGLMMIPQTFTNANQKIRVTMTIDNHEQQLFADLSPDLENPTSWAAGTTVTYKISTSSVNVLRISGVTYPTSWNAASNELNTIKSSYSSTDGDALGLYAIDANGAVVKENERLAKTSTGWADNILFVPDLTYFAYYPYSEDGLAHSGTKVVENETVVVTTPEDFFATGISSWAPAADQSTAAKLNAQDLQIGIGVLESASTLSFSMAHAMGLTSLTLGQGSIPRVRYFRIDENGNESTTGYIDSDESVNITASTDYTTTAIENINQKMLVSGQTRFYVVNPAQSVITLTGPSTGDGSWETPNVELDVTADHYKDYSVNHHGDYYYKGWLYQYRGKYQTFTVPTTGDYTIECWGASSYEKGMVANQAATADVPGCGGYVKGKITLDVDKTPTLYLYVGNKGSGIMNTSGGGGWNGGGNAISVHTNYYVGGGGGATDIRLTGTGIISQDKWNETASLRTRIMVAGGGGASGQDSKPGHAGGLEGYRASSTNVGSGYGGKQNEGGSPGPYYYDNGRASSGGFGYGSAGYSHAAGGGSGWYGGAGGTRNSTQDGSGGGGSSFVSGHTGCNPIDVSTGTHLGAGEVTTINSVAYAFNEIVMIDGAGYSWPATSTSKGSLLAMPNPLGGSYAEGVGHKGSGYVRITSLTPVE